MAKAIKIIEKEQFNRWAVLREVKSHRQPNGKLLRMVICVCVCECGTVNTISWLSLRTGTSKSCGCYMKKVNAEKVGLRSKTHGNTPLGENEYKSLFFVWNSIKQRCYNKKATKYPIYGAKGIKVCNEWVNDFPAFRDWAISKGYYKQAKGVPFKDKLSIDIIDPKGNYTPENCRWITISQNSSRRHINKSNFKTIKN